MTPMTPVLIGQAYYLRFDPKLQAAGQPYPPLGALVAKQLVAPDLPLPGFVSIAPRRTLTPSTLGPGFLGPRYAPLVIGDTPTGDAGSA